MRVLGVLVREVTYFYETPKIVLLLHGETMTSLLEHFTLKVMKFR